MKALFLKQERDHYDQQKSCLLPETFGAAKPTQTVSMSMRSALMVLDIKSVVRSTTREHVKQKYVVASPLKGILCNKDSDSGSIGFVFESIWYFMVLYDWYFMTFDAIGAFLMSFSAFLMLFCIFLTPFCDFLTPFCAFLTPFCAFLTAFCAFLTPFCAF